MDMGIEPFMVSAAMLGVIAQRLVRRLCPHCREAYLANTQEPCPAWPAERCKANALPRQRLQLLQRPRLPWPHRYSRSHAPFPAIKACIINGSSQEEVRKVACTEGMTTLNENLQQIVRDGITSIEEMLEVSSMQF